MANYNIITRTTVKYSVILSPITCAILTVIMIFLFYVLTVLDDPDPPITGFSLIRSPGYAEESRFVRPSEIRFYIFREPLRDCGGVG